VKGDQIYLTDFGLAVDFTAAEVSYTTNEFSGTYSYKAPESTGRVPHGRAADIFSLGCVFAEMLTVFNLKSIDDFARKRRGGHYGEDSFHKKLPIVTDWITKFRGDETSDFLVDMILDMLQFDSQERCKADDLKKRFSSKDNLNCSICRGWI